METESFKFAPPCELPSWPFVPPPDLEASQRTRDPLVIAGGGLSGLALACDLAVREGTFVLVRPDAYIAARLEAPGTRDIAAEMERTLR